MRISIRMVYFVVAWLCCLPTHTIVTATSTSATIHRERIHTTARHVLNENHGTFDEAIRKIHTDKALRTEQQQKLESALLLELRVLQNDPSLSLVEEAAPRIMEGIRRTIARRTRGEIDAPLVDIRLKETVSEAGVSAVAEKVKKLRVEVLEVHKEAPSLAARVHAIEDLQDIIDLPQVQSVSVIRHNHSKRLAGASRKETESGKRATSVSEGVKAHRVDVLRELLPTATGAGVRIGVISDGVESLQTSQNAGELPSTVTVLDAGEGDEGTAMLEIVHDMAPDAELYFATAYYTADNFAKNIGRLADAGCQIIVDDIIYLQEAPFQDDVVAQAVAKFVASGGLYFSSAGNEGNLQQETSGCYEGDFGAVSESLPGVGSVAVHHFAEDYWYNPFTSVVKDDTLQLTWNDPWNGGTALSDYDLYVINKELEIIAHSVTHQKNGKPIESIDDIYDVTDDSAFIVVVHYSGDEGRFIRLNNFGSELHFQTVGNVFGHSAVDGAFAVAAIDVALAKTTSFFQQRSSSLSVEYFSSDGPRRIFYNADGTAVTPDKYLVGQGAGTIRAQVPFITAANGVVTSLPDFNPFFGTSASAPHAGALAAILLSLRPSMTPDEVHQLFAATSIDICSPDFDVTSGYGVLDAVAMMVHGDCSSGQCTCDPGWVGSACQECPTGYGGGLCDACAAGYHGYPSCVLNPCSPPDCNGHGECDVDSKTCNCSENFVGAACDACADGYVQYPTCRARLCSTSLECSNNGDCTDGICECWEGYDGDHCSTCSDTSQEYPECNSSGKEEAGKPIGGAAVFGMVFAGFIIFAVVVIGLVLFYKKQSKPKNGAYVQMST